MIWQWIIIRFADDLGGSLMNNRKEIRLEIVNYLCGSDDKLSDRFIDLLKLSGMGVADGLVIKNKLMQKIDSQIDLDSVFKDAFKNQYKISIGIKDDLDIKLIKEFDDDCFKENLFDFYRLDGFPEDEFENYVYDVDYLNLVEKQYPQSIKEAVDMAIDVLTLESIFKTKEMDKSLFRNYVHFNLGLYMRNQFGLNKGRAHKLTEEFSKETGESFFQSDDMSGFLSDKIWLEVQNNFDEIVESKSKKEELPKDGEDNDFELAYESGEYNNVIKICEEILKSNPTDDVALTYQILSYYYLQDCKNALNCINSALKIFPDYLRFLNIKAHILFSLGCESEALDCLSGDDINTLNKRLFLLLKNGKVDEAYEAYKSLNDEIIFNGFKIQALARNLAKMGKDSEAIGCYNKILKKKIKPYTKFYYNYNDFDLFDKIKKDFIDYNLDLNNILYTDLYISWIDKITFEKPTEVCPICGNRLTPIVYADLEWYRFNKEKDEIVRPNTLSDIDPYNNIKEFYCRNCDREFDMGVAGIHLECGENYLQEKYGLEKIDLLNCYACQENIPKEKLTSSFDYFDEKEFDAFINKLKEIGYLTEVEKDLYKLECRLGD